HSGLHSFPTRRSSDLGEATKEGRLALTADNEVLTGREVIELLLYGDLVHVDRSKEKKLLRIRESNIAAGFHLAVIAVSAALAEEIGEHTSELQSRSDL